VAAIGGADGTPRGAADDAPVGADRTMPVGAGGSTPVASKISSNVTVSIPNLLNSGEAAALPIPLTSVYLMPIERLYFSGLTGTLKGLTEKFSLLSIAVKSARVVNVSSS